MSHFVVVPSVPPPFLRTPPADQPVSDLASGSGLPASTVSPPNIPSVPVAAATVEVAPQTAEVSGDVLRHSLRLRAAQTGIPSTIASPWPHGHVGSPALPALALGQGLGTTTAMASGLIRATGSPLPEMQTDPGSMHNFAYGSAVSQMQTDPGSRHNSAYGSAVSDMQTDPASMHNVASGSGGTPMQGAQIAQDASTHTAPGAQDTHMLTVHAQGAQGLHNAHNAIMQAQLNTDRLGASGQGHTLGNNNWNNPTVQFVAPGNNN